MKTQIFDLIPPPPPPPPVLRHYSFSKIVPLNEYAIELNKNGCEATEDFKLKYQVVQAAQFTIFVQYQLYKIYEFISENL